MFGDMDDSVFADMDMTQHNAPAPSSTDTATPVSEPPRTRAERSDSPGANTSGDKYGTS